MITEPKVAAMHFVAAASQFVKKAGETLAPMEKDAADASARYDDLIEMFVKVGGVANHPTARKQAADLLKTHVGKAQLISATLDKYAEAQDRLRQLGAQVVEPAEKSASVAVPAARGGVPTSYEMRPSDLAAFGRLS